MTVMRMRNAQTPMHRIHAGVYPATRGMEKLAQINAHRPVGNGMRLLKNALQSSNALI